MNKHICKVISVVTIVFAVISAACAWTVTGSGFLDLSNIARAAFVGFACLFGVIALLTGRKGWKS